MRAQRVPIRYGRRISVSPRSILTALRAQPINERIEALVESRIVRTVKFTIEDIEATERALTELFELCEREGTPVQLRKVGPDTWEFWCEEAPEVIEEEKTVSTVSSFFFPASPSESLRTLIQLRELVVRCMLAHARDEETDTPRIMVSQTRRPSPDRPGEFEEGIDVICTLNRQIIERQARER